MKKTILIFTGVVLAGIFVTSFVAAQSADKTGKKVEAYFETLFNKLKSASEQELTSDNFRQVMRPIAGQIDGLYGATLISPDFVIQQVYFPSHFLARGFDLKKVEELKDFYRMMKEYPAPQLSGPGHGSLFQPRLIAMRYPVIKEGKLKSIISIMVRAKSFLKAVGLDKCRAFKIVSKTDKLIESEGELSENHKEVILKLPSTEWVIQYDK